MPPHASRSATSATESRTRAGENEGKNVGLAGHCYDAAGCDRC
jgi:hypothetical protein